MNRTPGAPFIFNIIMNKDEISDIILSKISRHYHDNDRDNIIGNLYRIRNTFRVAHMI